MIDRIISLSFLLISNVYPTNSVIFIVLPPLGWAVVAFAFVCDRSVFCPRSGSQGGGAAPAAATDDAEESEEPPVPVVNTVKEDDAVYSKKYVIMSGWLQPSS